jgi:DNA-binding Lrp family transcriptional regulator
MWDGTWGTRYQKFYDLRAQNRFFVIRMAWETKVREMKGSYLAFVKVGTVPGQDEEVAKKLLAFEEVLEVHFISGDYDLLAVVEISLHGKTIFTPVQEITQFIVQKIRKVDGIRATSTMLPLRSLTKQK